MRALAACLAVGALVISGCASILGLDNVSTWDGDSGPEVSFRDVASPSDAGLAADRTVATMSDAPTVFTESSVPETGAPETAAAAVAADSNTPASNAMGAEGSQGDDAPNEAGCPAGQLACPQGCVEDDVRNCGACGHDCTSLPNVAGAEACDAGVCTFPPDACRLGFAHCSGSTDLGCETSITTKTNCGACGSTCGATAPVCANAGAAYACASGCPAATPNLCGSTCTDVASDPLNCSACGTACLTSVAHAQPTCMGGTCGYQCTSTFPTACDGGCADVTGDGANCGACGRTCTGGQQCVSSVCSCPDTTHLCGGQCVANDESACGATCTKCPTGATCTAGVCGCPSGTMNCNGACQMPGPGNSCGTSCNPCPAVTNGMATCGSSGCAVSCTTNYSLCGTQCVDKQTDGSNCGTCGHDCLTGACSGGVCQPVSVATGRTNPSLLAVNAAGVYWVEGATIVAVPISGGSPVALASGSNVSSPIEGFALGSANLFWSNGSNGADAYCLMKGSLTIAAGNLTLCYDKPTGAQPWGVAFSAGVVYWADSSVNVIYAASETSTSGATIVWDDSVQGPDAQPLLVAADTKNVYFTTGQSSVKQVPVGGGSLFLLQDGTTSVHSVAGLAIDATNVYWTDAVGGSSSRAIMKAGIGVGGASALVTADPSVLGVVAVDSSGVYWDNGNLMRSPAAGAPAVTVAAGQVSTSIALDPTAVYWTNSTAGTVMKVAK